MGGLFLVGIDSKTYGEFKDKEYDGLPLESISEHRTDKIVSLGAYKVNIEDARKKRLEVIEALGVPEDKIRIYEDRSPIPVLVE